MASTSSSTNAPVQTRAADDSLTPFEWIQLRSRALTIVLVAGLAIGAAFALWKRSVAIKEENAERAYYQALRTGQAGNAQATETELRRLVTRYAGTAAATQGAMSLAILKYDAGKNAEGVKVLEDVQREGVPESFAASIEALLAAGLSNQGQHVEAATRYRAAAEKALFPAERDSYLAESARSMMAANRPQDAIPIWKAIAENPDSPGAFEARVRLGELTARPVQ